MSLGAVAAAFAVFAPPYFFVLVGGPDYRRLADVPQVKAFVQGVSATAVGAFCVDACILARAFPDRYAYDTHCRSDVRCIDLDKESP